MRRVQGKTDLFGMQIQNHNVALKGPRRRMRDGMRWKTLGGPSLYSLETLELLWELHFRLGVMMGSRQIATLSALSLSTARQSR